MEAQVINHYIPIWLGHIRSLAEDIGPRGSTTIGEREAAHYCEQAFRKLNLHPKLETFASAKSIYHPHLLASAVMLLAFLIYPLNGRAATITAALLSFLSIASQLLELSFRDNIYRRLVPKAESQNVVAVMATQQEVQQDLVLIGHVDSHRTPLIFRSPTWVKAYQAFTTIAFVLFLVQGILYMVGSITQWTWIWPATIPSAVGSVLLAAICIQADRTPFSHGANDNATGVGMILTLAEHLQKEPLRNTRIWLVCTGCEEVQHYGAIDFFRRHTSELQKPVSVVFEMLGCAGPAWLTKEGIIIPFHADRELVRIAERIAAENPHLQAYPSQIKGGNTEMADALRAGVPAITLNGIGPKGEMPYWHQVQDTVDKMDAEVMRRAYEFTWRMLQAIDARSP